ncbi:insulinase family protein [Adlercreutzia muris]|jgi:Zn-dependent M16 (insulinase) family peptidase|uniref:Peptidase M16 n=2 Tax=Adlercreutzia muris TaxID=1796610 RepID=A0A7C8FVG2_9ACTN|nr:insulinase family protein [Adlercreutzia muris]KAB1640297.1 peptidase M16 [Adlercreutzia muris]MCI8305849.1 peptidase M16 [Enterorhabdus sp.]MCR2029031.1 insulinase family protein [Adlercreutzia muris]
MTDTKTITARHGFAWERSEDLPEIEGTAHLMTHVASGARLMYLANDDANKAFSISFKTPAADDTGVFHILEHSVLCGSEKFPVKEPFVNLLKTSMQTFLNAMTFPDKTMYPVASTNERDLLNLMDVYLDAVFRPNIYKRPAIFEQEGWHWELEGEGDEERLVYNGVVYNEMRGALSEPDAVLFNGLSAALFPDTTYRFESGGTPAAIPTLTYEAFLENHRRHYRPDNSYIILYGNLDLDRFLAFIDEGYLAPLSAEERGPLKANPLGLQAPVVAEPVAVAMDTAPENACAAVGSVIGTAAERERVLAADILIDAVMGSNEAPLKRALLDAGIADDALGYVVDSVAQPFAVVSLRGARPGAAERLEEIVRSEAARLADGGLDRDLVRAALAHGQFVMRERNFGYADGVVLAMAALGGWLYSDDDPMAYLRFDDLFAALTARVEEGYFERLLRELFCESGHWARAEVVPAGAYGEAAAEADARRRAAALDPQEAEAIRWACADLRAAQEAPDDPAAVAKLPQLTRGDIGPAPAEEMWEEARRDGVDLVRHHVPTHGLAYAYRYYDLASLAFEELPYAAVLASVLGKLDTARHSAAEIDTLSQAHLGNMGFACEVHEDVDDRDRIRPVLVAGASALGENAAWMATLVDEVLTETDFSDTERIRDILAQWRIAMEQSFAANGHTAAMARAASYYLPADVVREALAGVDYYRFLRDLLDSFDERADDLAAKLGDLARRLVVDGNCTVSLAGSDADLDRFWEARTPADGPRPEAALAVPAPVNRREAFAVPTDVTYTACGWDRRLTGLPYTGPWLLASRILTYDYLWGEVRVKGGAYGVGFRCNRAGSCRFYSYRDPRIDETRARFAEAGSWLAGAFDPTEAEMDGYVVSVVASLDAPEKARALLRRQDGMYFAGYGIAERAAVRREVALATAEEVRALGPAVDAIAGADCVCVFGNRDIIEAASGELTVIDLLNR